VEEGICRLIVGIICQGLRNRISLKHTVRGSKRNTQFVRKLVVFYLGYIEKIVTEVPPPQIEEVKSKPVIDRQKMVETELADLEFARKL
jgi:hypothetical protein